MKEPSFQLFVCTYLNDPEFRENFDKDRVKAVKSMGYKITPAIQEALENLDLEALRNLADSMSYGFC
jgi:cobalamin biosynthesis Mg chelatase CobN